MKLFGVTPVSDLILRKKLARLMHISLLRALMLSVLSEMLLSISWRSLSTKARSAAESFTSSVSAPSDVFPDSERIMSRSLLLRSQQVVDHGLQQFGVERLGHVYVGALLVADDFVLVGDFRREDHDGNVAQHYVVLDLAAEFVSVHLRHQDIGDYHVGHFGVDQVEPVDAVVGNENIEPRGKDRAAVELQLRIVFDEDDFRPRFRMTPPPAFRAVRRRRIFPGQRPPSCRR